MWMIVIASAIIQQFLHSILYLLQMFIIAVAVAIAIAIAVAVAVAVAVAIITVCQKIMTMSTMLS